MATTKEKTASAKKAAPAEKKTTTAKTTEKKAAAPKKVATKASTTKATASKKAPAKTSAKKAKIGPEQRYKMVEVAAYYLAERNGFAGNPSDYWIEAEAQIEVMLSK